MRKYSYESILRTVGQVLDEADAKSFAIQDTENGLRVEMLDRDGKQEVVLDLGLADVAELVEMKSEAGPYPSYERSYAHDEGTLHQFLERHQLVGAGR
jgi:hypothetical protein